MGSSGQGLRLRSAAQTDMGQVRANNEDSVRLWASPEYALAVVADGMGGAAAGEEASRLAVEEIEARLVTPNDRSRAFLDTVTETSAIVLLQEAIRAGNASILTRVAAEPELKGMGTTVTLAFVRGGQAIVAHVGDSRAYLVQTHTGRIQQISTDHSYVDLLIAAGQITEKQAEDHPLRNVLYRALGQSEIVEIDVYTPVRLKPGDRVVLCSDGLTRHVRPDEIGAVVVQHDDPQAACNALIAQANGRGGEDNISVVVIAADADGSEAGFYAGMSDDSTLDLKKIRLEEETLRLNQDLLKRKPD